MSGIHCSEKPMGTMYNAIKKRGVNMQLSVIDVSVFPAGAGVIPLGTTK